MLSPMARGRRRGPLLHMGQQPLHVVAAVDVEAGIGYVITAYRPDLEHFEADYKTRRRT